MTTELFAGPLSFTRLAFGQTPGGSDNAHASQKDSNEAAWERGYGDMHSSTTKPPQYSNVSFRSAHLYISSFAHTRDEKLHGMQHNISHCLTPQ